MDKVILRVYLAERVSSPCAIGIGPFGRRRDVGSDDVRVVVEVVYVRLVFDIPVNMQVQTNKSKDPTRHRFLG